MRTGCSEFYLSTQIVGVTGRYKAMVAIIVYSLCDFIAPSQHAFSHYMSVVIVLRPRYMGMRRQIDYKKAD